MARSTFVSYRFNRDDTERSALLEPYWGKWPYNGPGTDARRFERAPLSVIEALMKRGFLDPSGTQNDSPTARQLADLMKRHPGITADGYTIHRLRKDYRVTLDGVGVDPADVRDPVHGKSIQGALRRVALKYRATSFREAPDGRLYAWWD